MAIGERLRQERERLGFSQASFAEKTGIHRNTQARYELNKREPDASYLEAIRGLGVDDQYVLFGTKTSDIKKAKDDIDEGYYEEFGRACAAFLGISPTDLVRYQEEAMEAANQICKLQSMVDIAGVNAYKPWKNKYLKPELDKRGEALILNSSFLKERLSASDSLDSGLLTSMLENVEQAASTMQNCLSLHKKARVIAMLYRTFQKGGNIDHKMIEEAVYLAGGE